MRLLLSPHFDDAVYSAGASLYQWAQQDEPIHVVTTMAGNPPAIPDSPITRDLHERWQAGDSPVLVRQAEDKRALARLGVQCHHLNLYDCVYRTNAEGQPLYPDGNSLFASVAPDDTAPLNLQRIDWQALLGQPLNQCTIFAPLAVGHHVDHQIVREWALTLMDVSIAVFLYADYPYTRDIQAIQKAQAQLTGFRLDPYPNIVSHTAMETKIASAADYVSQVSTFWQDTDALHDDMLASFRHSTGDFVEQFWRVLPG